MALPREDRLRRREEIQRLFQQGNRDERPSFVALWQSRPEGRRVGFAVSRRIAGSVARNRARRRLREAFRRQQPQLHVCVGVVFVARPGLVKRPFGELLGEMRQALDGLNRSAKQARRGTSQG